MNLNSQCKTPPRSMEMMGHEGNPRIFGNKEGKSNKGGPNGGISTIRKKKNVADVGY